MGPEGKVFTAVISESEIPVGTQKALRVAGERLLLLRTEHALYAVENLCSHALLPLEGCRISGGVLTCPHHGARFELQSGRSLSILTKKPLRTFATRIQDSMVEVALEKGRVAGPSSAGE
jgi:3-phenylpropionate/trans-cinnamate dioxygenase ferredoxin subunit